MRMKTIMATGLCCAGLAGGALAEDNEAGVPLTPSEAAGSWTLESAGHNICRVTLETTKRGDGYAARSEPACGDTLGGLAAGWQPTHDRMRLVGADGGPLLGFSRWSNSLFVSHRASGVDVQLRRGGAPDRPAD